MGPRVGKLGGTELCRALMAKKFVKYMECCQNSVLMGKNVTLQQICKILYFHYNKFLFWFLTAKLETSHSKSRWLVLLCFHTPALHCEQGSD